MLNLLDGNNFNKILRAKVYFPRVQLVAQRLSRARDRMVKRIEASAIGVVLHCKFTRRTIQGACILICRLAWTRS